MNKRVGDISVFFISFGPNEQAPEHREPKEPRAMGRGSSTSVLNAIDAAQVLRQTMGDTLGNAINHTVSLAKSVEQAEKISTEEEMKRTLVDVARSVVNAIHRVAIVVLHGRLGRGLRGRRIGRLGGGLG